VSPQAVQRDAERAFGTLAPGVTEPLPLADWRGGVLTRAQSGSSQSHLALGFGVASRRADDPVATVAAALLGEGMSSPLLDRVREQQGLAYYTACSADVLDMSGQFVIEASTAPGDALRLVGEVMALLRQQAAHAAPAELERARHQLAVRELRAQERGLRWLEEMALEWLATDDLRPQGERTQRWQAVSAEQVRGAFESMLGQVPALALTGAVSRGMRERLRQALAGRAS
jgi:predicted Zn-dependent peptidase